MIGAGFASGQEIVKFFVDFGSMGVWGAVLGGSIIALVGGFTTNIVNKNNISNYGDLLSFMFPQKIAKLMDIIIFISIWVSLGVMFIGSSNILFEQFGIPVFMGVGIISTVICLFLWVGIDGLLRANSVLVPFLIILTLFSSTYYLVNPLPCLQVKSSLLPNWWVSGILYATLNMLLGIVIITSLKEENKKIPLSGGILGGVILGVLSLLIIKSLSLLPHSMLYTEMPLLTLSLSINKVIGNLYIIGLLVAMLTTALADTHSVCKRLERRFTYRKALPIIIISTFVFIPFKFSVLVGFLYPVIGYIGIPLVLGVFWHGFKSLKIR